MGKNPKRDKVGWGVGMGINLKGLRGIIKEIAWDFIEYVVIVIFIVYYVVWVM